MPLTHPIFRDNARIRRAAESSPSMSRGEPDREAVQIMQRALRSVRAGTLNRSFNNGVPDGIYATETVEAVRRFQTQRGLLDRHGHADGIAGRAFWAAMDREAPHDLAPPPVPAGAQTPETPETTRAPNRPRLPTADALLRVYRSFRELPRPGKPCGRNITNQCGIRMSVALMRCDIGFHYEGPHLGGSLIHDNPRACGIDIPHTPYLFQLMDHMAEFWHCETFHMSPSHPEHTPLRDVIQRCENSPGIILFRGMSELQEPPSIGTGSHRHIDYWDGHWVMNDLLNYNAPNERAADARIDHYRFFRRATTIRFIALDGQ